MHYSTCALLLAAMTIGDAVAGPTHAHLHKHTKRDVDWSKLDWNNMGIDWAAAYAAGQAAKSAAGAAAPASTAAAPAPAAPSPSAEAPAVAPAPAAPEPPAAPVNPAPASSNEGLWHGLVGHSNGLTAFGGFVQPSGSPGDSYKGNYGSPYGSNVIKVGSAAGYQFTNTFTNSQSKSITVNIWNKVGPDGLVQSGPGLAPRDTTLTFVLGPGATQVVAFMDDSQVAWCEATDAIHASGAYATTWGEANFNSKGSGYDVSAILNAGGNNYDMSISSAEASSCTSNMKQNFWVAEFTPVGNSDGSCYIAQTSATLKTTMGGTV